MISQMEETPRPSIRFTACSWIQQERCHEPYTETEYHTMFILMKGQMTIRVRERDKMAGVVFQPEQANGDFVLRSGDVISLLPGVSYMLYSEEEFACYQITWQGNQGIALPRYFILTDPVRVLQLIRQLMLYGENGSYPAVMGDYSMLLLLGELSMQAGKSDGSGSRLYTAICDYIHANADRPITVQEIAEKFEYNPDYLRRVFAAHNPVGLKEHIVRERLNCAKYLLLTTSLPIKDIADRLHFPDYKQFLNFFTYHESMSPTKLRKTFASVDFDKL